MAAAYVDQSTPSTRSLRAHIAASVLPAVLVSLSLPPFRFVVTMASGTRIDYLRDTVFPRATADGAFGPGVAYETFAVDDCAAAADAVTSDHFASYLVFGTVTVTVTGSGDRHRHRVVIKFKNADAQLSAMMNMHKKFHNEYVFYARILPELACRAADPADALALFPRFIYSNATPDGLDAGDGGEQVIVVANATPDGYRPAADDGRVGRLFLDAGHALLALHKLGALHGLSYAAKARPDGGRELIRLTAALSDTQWFDGHWYKSPNFLSGSDHYFSVCPLVSISDQ